MARQGLAGRYAVSGQILEAIAVGQRALAQSAARRREEEQWNARLPATMAALFEQERLREIPPPTPSEPSVDVAVHGAAEPFFPELPCREVRGPDREQWRRADRAGQHGPRPVRVLRGKCAARRPARSIPR
ncbi:MAG: hypothetical protein LC689_20790 [Myxococcales bacterium]|nr:hypothetical protein [Myxococcales bacterium]